MREKNINVYFVKPSKQVLYSLYMNMIKHLKNLFANVLKSSIMWITRMPPDTLDSLYIIIIVKKKIMHVHNHIWKDIDYLEPSSDKEFLDRLYIIVIYKNIEKARQEQQGNYLKEEASNVAENKQKVQAHC